MEMTVTKPRSPVGEHTTSQPEQDPTSTIGSVSIEGKS